MIFEDLTICFSTLKEIGERFGVSYTSITGTIKRAEKYLQDKTMKEKVEVILNDI